MNWKYKEEDNIKVWIHKDGDKVKSIENDSGYKVQVNEKTMREFGNGALQDPARAEAEKLVSVIVEAGNIFMKDK